MKSRILGGIFTLAFVLGFLAPARAQHEHPAPAAPPERLGTVHFETSCSPDIRADFDRAIALLHSFWHSAAIDGFGGVLSKDPGCAIAYWGIALSHWGNPFGGFRSPQALLDGQAAIEKGAASGSPTPRERAYIAAAAELFKDHDTLPQRQRTLAYERAMEQVYRQYPQDKEAAAFYALAVNQTALPTDKTYGNQLKATAILEPLFEGAPDHPGLAHYIIHAYDHPPLAARALVAARSYAKIAPAAPHALHMPSHTFTRLGYWQESVDTNIASAAAARKANSPGEVLHAFDYQAYAYLQMAQDKAAKHVLDDTQAVMASIDAGAGYGVAGLYAAAAVLARYALERGAWAEAAALVPRTTAFGYTDAITHFARALGAARSGNPAAAKADVEGLAALRDKLAEMKDAYWTEQVEIQRQVAAAWVAYAEGRKDDGLRLMRTAADTEDATDKSGISPGPIAPARELFGEMLLDAGRPKDALAAFEATMKKEPNRFRGAYGAARAAEVEGDRDAAADHYRHLLEIAGAADTERPELRQARAFVGRK